MPKENINGSIGNGQRVEVSWARDDHVTISVATSKAPGATLVLDPGAATDVRGWGCAMDAAGMDRLIASLQKARRQAFGSPPPTAAVIEIIEPGRATDGTIGGSIIVPAEVRINGHQVLTTGGGVRIHEITMPPREMAQVTMTLPARRITVAAEGDLA